MFAVTPSDVFADPPDPSAPPTAVYENGSDTYVGVWGIIDRVFSTFRSLIYGPPYAGVVECRQRTDNAHKSGTSITARVNVHVDARCPARVAEMFHTATLLRSNNPQYGYRQVTNLTPKRGIYHKYNTSFGRAVANHHCSRHWFKGTGAGYVVYRGVDARSIAATSSPRPEFNPCGLP